MRNCAAAIREAAKANAELRYQARLFKRSAVAQQRELVKKLEQQAKAEARVAAQSRGIAQNRGAGANGAGQAHSLPTSSTQRTGAPGFPRRRVVESIEATEHAWLAGARRLGNIRR
jgi:hypothetical protein